MGLVVLGGVCGVWCVWCVVVCVGGVCGTCAVWVWLRRMGMGVKIPPPDFFPLKAFSPGAIAGLWGPVT